MQYRNDRHGAPISLLGYGCMRFTRKGSGIDLDKAEREVMRAIDLGVNYLDTAYIYPGSEAAVGEILRRNQARGRVSLATKLPQYLIRDAAGIERIFQEELSRLQTDHIDYYLMHMLTDLQAWKKLQALGIESWIAQKKQSGAIRNIGFSFHGSTEIFLSLLDAYDWDFCQIQYNYMDEYSQAGRQGLQAAAARGIPVIIMEPLRGGKLVDLLPEAARAAIARDPKGRTPAELALRWLWEQPEVTCVLSGMNSVDMVEENCRIASSVRAGEFDDEDRALIEQVRSLINAKMRIGCTGCGYCMPCPKGVDIPQTFRCWNEMYTESRGAGRHEYAQVVCLRKDGGLVDRCVGCQRCEHHCPQHLSIVDALKEADRELRPWYYRPVLAVIRGWMFRGKGNE